MGTHACWFVGDYCQSNGNIAVSQIVLTGSDNLCFGNKNCTCLYGLVDCKIKYGCTTYAHQPIPGSWQHPLIRCSSPSRSSSPPDAGKPRCPPSALTTLPYNHTMACLSHSHATDGARNRTDEHDGRFCSRSAAIPTRVPHSSPRPHSRAPPFPWALC